MNTRTYVTLSIYRGTGVTNVAKGVKAEARIRVSGETRASASSRVARSASALASAIAACFSWSRRAISSSRIAASFSSSAARSVRSTRSDW